MTPTVSLPPVTYSPDPSKASVVLPPREPGPTRLHPEMWQREMVPQSDGMYWADPTADAAIGRCS